MVAKPAESNGFEETQDVPTGRKAREVSDELWTLLAGSAERGTAWVKTAPNDVIDALKKDLGTAKVRAKYKVTIESEKVDDDTSKLKFSASVKPPAETPVAADA